MKKFLHLFMLLFFLGAMTATAIAATIKTPFPDNVILSVALELKLEMDKDGEHRISGNLIVSNPSHHVLRVQHPENRSVLTFIVTDSLGNIVMPKGLAKIDPEMRLVDIDTEADYEYQFEYLRFLTDSAQFTYQLKNGGVYKVIAVFRPAGSEGPGFTSNEVLINIF